MGKSLHIFLLNVEYGVGRESKLVWASPGQAVHFGS